MFNSIKPAIGASNTTFVFLCVRGRGGGGDETTVPYNGTFQGQLDKRVGSKLGGGGEEWQGEGVSKREPQSSCHVSGDLCPPSKSFPS